MRWMAANVAVAHDPAGNLKPAKESTERIDGIVALIMAIGRAMVAQEEPQPEYSMFFVEGQNGAGHVTPSKRSTSSSPGRVGSSRSHAGTSMPSAGGVHVIIRALCRWHFQPGGGPEYCRACDQDGLPCARGEPGADGRLCPYREHALISTQEHETWEVLLACQGQLRIAPAATSSVSI